MLKPVNFLLPGLFLVLGLALAWAGGARTQGSAPNNQDFLTQMRLRDETLFQEMKDLRREMEELKKKLQKSAETKAKTNSVRAPMNEAPRGKIITIDPTDISLVEVNLGKDDGLEKHNTLDVYRPGSSPEYIGMLRVFEVYNQSVFCRLVSTNPLKNQTIQVGDLVGRKGEW